MFGLFRKKAAGQKQYENRLVPLRKCWCGSEEFGFLRGGDAVHCNSCGAFYLIYHVADPVAKVERVEVSRKAA